MGYTPPWLKVSKITEGWSLTPPTSTAGDDLYIYANSTDATPIIVLIGGTKVRIYNTTNQPLNLFDSVGADYFGFLWTTPDSIIETYTNYNLYLKPHGTGLIKVKGTATATGDVAINGHYDILDENGATIKLARVA